MIYEIRTYALRTGAVPEFEERYEKRLPLRLKHSPLGAFWHTEFGPLNQVVHITPTMIFSTARGSARRWRKIPSGTRSPAARI
jgi:NIPSNAP